MKCTIRIYVLVFLAHFVNCWTSEDMELFDLVENTPQNFYDVLGVNSKASSSEIKKAYRKLSTIYHPDKSKESNAEETFRRIAAVADVLRNEERRKQYDIILQTGLPDWRAPIYYYRRVRNMGLFEMTLFLFSLATLAQYLFAWSSYWEQKYEIEEVILSKVRRKAKNQKKRKGPKIDEEAIESEVMSGLQKPRCQDLFPIRLVCFIVYVIKSSPSFVENCKEYIKQRNSAPDSEEESDDDSRSVARVRCKKQAKKPNIPDVSSISSCDVEETNIVNTSPITITESEGKPKQTWVWDKLTEQQVIEFKKAIKKFPVGTLQRWEKVAAYLDCSVSEVVTMIKEMKSQQISKSVPASAQGVTGVEKENLGSELYCQKGETQQQNANFHQKDWNQQEQRSLEVALQKYPKDTPARWDKVSAFVSTKSKEECIERFKILAQQIKQRKDKSV